MPYRKVPLVTDEFYHLFTRGVAKAPIFTDRRSHQRFMQTISYYQFANCPKKLSHFLPLSIHDRNEIEEQLFKENLKLVDLLCYCLMPNHFHLLVRQLMDRGISEYMRKVNHSYTKFINTRKERVGALLQGPFKAVRIQTDEQLLHVSRYIHINPYIGNVIIRDHLTSYPYSSLPVYLGSSHDKFLNKDIIMKVFKFPSAYKKFILDEADYKKSQESIAHLTLEKTPD